MSDRNRKSNARRKAVRKYQREHGVSYTEALRAVGDPPEPRMHQFLLLAGFEDDGEEVLFSMDGVGGSDVLWISGSTRPGKFLALFMLAAQYCQIGARVVACARRAPDPEWNWTGYRDELDRFVYIEPEQLEAVVDELAASTPAAGVDPVPAVLLIDDWPIQSGPHEIDFGRLNGLNIVVMVGMSQDSFALAQEFWKVRVASHYAVDSFPPYLGRRGGASGRLMHAYQPFVQQLHNEGAVVAEAYSRSEAAVPPPEEFVAALEAVQPGDFSQSPDGFALSNTAAGKKFLFHNSPMQIIYLNTPHRSGDKDQDAD